MPSALEVQPAKWSDISVLFDNGEYSVISGIYEQRERRLLGERWNGNDTSPRGFPNTSGHPVWHVVPDFLEVPVLHAILDEVTAHPMPSSNDSTESVLRELRRINRESPESRE